MRTAAVLLLACGLLSQSMAQTLGLATEHPQTGTYVLEGLGGVVGLGAGAACGVLVTYGVTAAYVAVDPNAGWDALGVAAITALACGAALPACAGYGVSVVGDNMVDADGSPTGAYVGAYAAAPVAILLGMLGNCARASAGKTTGLVLGALVIPAGAVIGYNWPASSADRPHGSLFSGRVGIPAVALGRIVREDRTAEYGLKVEVASVRF